MFAFGKRSIRHNKIQIAAKSGLYTAAIFFQLAVITLIQPTKVFAEVSRTETTFGPNHVPICQWHDSSIKTKGVIVAIHGLIMHGRVYDAMSKRLASEGFLVVAPDLRGYGRWMQNAVHNDPDASLDYRRAYTDLVSLVTKLKNDQPQLPLYCVGESLGAVFALHVASEKPGLVSGLVLSSPAVKRQSFVSSITTRIPLVMTNPWNQMDLVPYIKHYVSEDPRVVEEALNDPLVRKQLSVFDLIKTNNATKPALNYAKNLSAQTPVLILQGAQDRMVKSDGAFLLLTKLHARDKNIHWFNDSGHILLETAFIKPDTFHALDNWLQLHMANNVIVTKAPNTASPTNRTPPSDLSAKVSTIEND